MAGSPLKKARRLAAAKDIDLLDEPAMRPALRPIAWNRVELTDEQRAAVAQAVMDHYPRNEIARALGVTVKTLKRILDDEPELTDAVEAAREAEEAELRDCLMRSARSGDTVAALFLLKTRHGYRDRDDGKVKVENRGGGVLVVPGTVPLHEWEASAAIQQAQYRERIVDPPEADYRTSSPGVDGLRLERTQPGDLTP